MKKAQNESRRPLRATAQYVSGGHGIRTHLGFRRNRRMRLRL